MATATKKRKPTARRIVFKKVAARKAKPAAKKRAAASPKPARKPARKPAAKKTAPKRAPARPKAAPKKPAPQFRHKLQSKSRQAKTWTTVLGGNIKAQLDDLARHYRANYPALSFRVL